MTTTPTASTPADTPRFRLTHSGGRVEADTLTDLVAGLVGDEYRDLDPTLGADRDALLLRWQQAVTTANLVQAVVVGSASESGVLDVSTASEDVLTVLFSDRVRPVEVDDWAEPVPLVLISTDYAPFTHRTPPTGNVRWINPHTERTYLESLHHLGVVDLEVAA